MTEQASPKPTRKVVAGGLAGAASIVCVWILNRTLFKADPMPPEIASAMTTILSAAVSYFVKPRDEDMVAK